MKKKAIILTMITGAVLVTTATGKDTADGDLTRATGPKKISTIVDRRAKTVDWSPDGEKIAFGRWERDGYVDVYLMNPDGSDMRSLTGAAAGCPRKQNGNPAWHPSGKYIVFTAEKYENPDRFSRWAIPGSGFNCDLWAMTVDGKEIFQLTDYPLIRPYRAVIHPHFSHDGRKLLWAERVDSSADFTWGEWALKMADFIVDGSGPRLENITTYQPGKRPRFYESHAFSPDDNKILFSGNPDGQTESGFDIYKFDPESRELTNLTDSPEEWDEHAQYSPDGEKIVWMSSRGLGVEIKSIKAGAWKGALKSELWIMDADGMDKRQLTHFNEPGNPEYMGGRRCIVSDISFSPTGRRLIALVAYEDSIPAGLNAMLVMIEL